MPSLSSAFDTLGSFYGPQNAPANNPSNNPSTGSSTVVAAMTGAPPEQQTVQTINLLPQLKGTVLGMPVTHLFLLIAVGLVIYYFVHRHVPDIESKISTPRVGLGSFFSIGFQALVFIVVMKVVFTKIKIPGLSDVIATA
jgi:hypothetical protein